MVKFERSSNASLSNHAFDQIVCSREMAETRLGTNKEQRLWDFMHANGKIEESSTNVLTHSGLLIGEESRT